MDFSNLSIAVLLPCYNEANSIAGVVLEFRKALPSAQIYVYDNNSTDETAQQAILAGAIVVPSPRQGKGNVVRQMFSDIEADIYLMADGDGTYDAAKAPVLIEKLLTDRLDMVVGTRKDVKQDAGRKGHAFGNAIFNRIYRFAFGNDFSDIFSGFRAFNRRFAKSFPAESPGFEIETEMSVHASVLRLPVAEIECDYGRRGEGSESKLSTFRDGFKILRMIGTLLKETRPFIFFGAISAVIFATSLIFIVPVLIEYFQTGLVERAPSWVLGMTLVLAGMMTFTAGMILDSLARSRAEQKRIFYLSIAPSRGEGYTHGLRNVLERRDDEIETQGIKSRKSKGK
ncbi:MAG: glycosyltransferase [Hellea sp.]|nr:glycosyltransferase [Hellea sp.]